jgi:hypothetical protein
MNYCLWCGKEFEKGNFGIFCSEECHTKHLEFETKTFSKQHKEEKIKSSFKDIGYVLIGIFIIMLIIGFIKSFSEPKVTIHRPSYEGKTTEQMTPQEFKQWYHDMEKAEGDARGSPFDEQLGY